MVHNTAREAVFHCHQDMYKAWTPCAPSGITLPLEHHQQQVLCHPASHWGLELFLAQRLAVSGWAGAAVWSSGWNQPPEGTSCCSCELWTILLPTSSHSSSCSKLHTPSLHPVFFPLTFPHLPQVQLWHLFLSPNLFLLLLCCVDAGEAGPMPGGAVGHGAQQALPQGDLHT